MRRRVIWVKGRNVWPNVFIVCGKKEKARKRGLGYLLNIVAAAVLVLQDIED